MPQKCPRYGLDFVPVKLMADFPVHICRQPDHGDLPIERLHTHDCLELGLCHRGAGIFIVGEKTYSFDEGDAIAIARGEPHFARSSPGTTSDWSWIWVGPWAKPGRPASVSVTDADAWRGPGFVNLVSGRQETDWCVTLRLLINELTGRRPGWRDAAHGLLHTILAMGERRCSRQQNVIRVDLTRLAPAVDYIGQHFRQPVGSPQLAKLCHMSDTHFRREFKRLVGKPVHQYLLELRVRAAAAELGAGGKTCAECAFDSGFESLSSFQRAFRSTLHCSPREWKNGTRV